MIYKAVEEYMRVEVPKEDITIARIELLRKNELLVVFHYICKEKQLWNREYLSYDIKDNKVLITKT